MLCPSCHLDQPGWPDRWSNDPADRAHVHYICAPCTQTHKDHIMVTNRTFTADIAQLAFRLGNLTGTVRQLSEDLLDNAGAVHTHRLEAMRTRLSQVIGDSQAASGIINGMLVELQKGETP